MKKQTYGRYGKFRHSRGEHVYFLGLSLLSFFFVFCIAILSRAELRLSGEMIAAGDEKDLSVLAQMNAFTSVELIRETDNLRLYILKGGKQQYLAEVVKQNGEWKVSTVEKLRSSGRKSSPLQKQKPQGR